MSEWWTYGLSDFLMFSPQAYWRLVARYNQAWWPAQVLGLAGALGLLLLLRKEGQHWRRAVLVLLAAAWAWVGWAFHTQRYSEIFLAASWVGGACGLEALLLLAAAVLSRHRPATAVSAGATAGLVLVALALLYPLVALPTGHAPAEAEVFGFMPDPTALATLGCLLALRELPTAVRAALAILPALSLALGGATRWLLA
jgi:hypothetical protein